MAAVIRRQPLFIKDEKGNFIPNLKVLPILNPNGRNIVHNVRCCGRR